jgi:hypothetical protein
MNTCPVCSSSECLDTVRRELLPAMQNYVYRTREAACGATRGRFVLAVCRSCGFAWNRAFDPGLLCYDENYDNAVPSAVMAQYYAELAGYLTRKYLADGGLIVEIGCGDGAFLRTICAASPYVHGLGVDPALKQTQSDTEARIVLRKGVFRPEQIVEQPALVLSRHVLEHIPQPVEFLSAVARGTSRFDACACFFEVPDLDWILTNGTFWDFCYEHCNYFTAASIAEAMRRARLAPTSHRTGFGSQYLWNEGMTAAPTEASPTAAAKRGDLAARAAAYADHERSRIDAMRRFLQVHRDQGKAVAVWGMATKGVIFSLLVDPDASLIEYCIDVNANKQGCFVPLTGHAISAPTALRSASRPVTVMVMNENYRDEIAATCRDIGIHASLVTLDRV